VPVGLSGNGHTPLAGAKSVLVADDDSAVRQSLIAILQLEGYAVLPASNFEEARNALRDEHVDVLVVDVVMRDTHGLALLNELDGPPPVVIVHSSFGYLSEEEVRHHAGHRVFRFLKKPTHPTLLLKAVGEATRSRP
jgi:DNA-binding NtrC family response regulator